MKDPLNASRFEQKPCLSLTQAQLRELNVGPQGSQRETPLGQACEWSNPETQGSTEISFVSKDPRGLSGTYKAKNDGKWAYFEELPEIEGFPAVARSAIDNRNRGACSLEVGVTDKLSFQLALSLSQANVGKKNPCDVAAQVVGMALKTMKAGG